MDDKTKEIISKDPSLCEYWCESRCFFEIGGWRNNSNLNNIHDPNIPKCNFNKICDKCKPDTVLYSTKKSYYE